jgi:hypothetical protein
MQNEIQGTELSIAILMDDLASAKEIASALRQNNILAHHYQTLEEFWVATNIQIPDLVIVDVIKMSQGSVQFRNHPRVIDHSLRFAFFSKDSTKILLQSTVGLDAYSYVHNDSTLNAQILGLASRLKKEIKTEKNLLEMESRVHRLQTRSQRLISERSQAEEFKAQFEFIRQLCGDLEIQGKRQDFATALINKLDQWESIDSCGLFELNQNGQKLISPEISRKKYHPFPSLWLGQANNQGIESFAEDMAVQVANDLFETEPVLIKIHASFSAPEILLFVAFKEERMSNFPWDTFALMLSGTLRQLRLQQQIPKPSSQFMPAWEGLDLMDRLQKATSETGDTRILCLSFIPLMNVVKKRNQNKFFWSAFFNDFFLQLSTRLSKTTKLSQQGPWHLIFFVQKENLEVEFQMLQTFIKQFGFWKFFEDNSQVLSEEMMPGLKLIPASSAHYLRIFEKEFEDMATANEDKRLLRQVNQEQVKRIN